MHKVRLLNNKTVNGFMKKNYIVPQMTTNVPFHKGVRIALKHVLSHPEEYEEDPDFDDFCDRVIAALEKAKKEI